MYKLQQMGMDKLQNCTLYGVANVVDSQGNGNPIVCIVGHNDKHKWTGDWSHSSDLWTEEAKE